MIAVESVDAGYSRLVLNIDSSHGSRDFWFKGGRCISPLAFFARTWAVRESKYFRFFISDPAFFNDYCPRRLDLFVAHMASLLELNDKDLERLRRQKIYYYLSRNEDEIQRLTGYRVRGMYNLAYDAVVTTFNAHYHELLHLLINYRLRHLPMYTHPFLQEGFAVAYGGRGGLDPGALLPVGRFLFQSGFVEWLSLADAGGFRQTDPSLSYPAAGLYNRFLIETIGVQSYLQLYRSFSSTSGIPGGLHIPPDRVPGESVWNSYLRNPPDHTTISLDTTAVNGRVLLETKTLRVSEDSEWYHFLLSGTVVLQGAERYPHYTSRAFQNAFPDHSSTGGKYMVCVTPDEISVYNLLTNNLIASYAAGFANPALKIPQAGALYRFSLRKDLFDEPVRSFIEIPPTGKK